MSERLVSGSFTHLLEGVDREEIHITEVRHTPLTYKPADGSYVHECGPVVLAKKDEGFIEILTDRGIVGVGAARHNAPDYSHLIGRNPFDVELLGLTGGPDVACWDIIGQVTGRPVYDLLATDNAPAPNVHVYASGGVMWTHYDKGDGSPFGADSLIEEALRYKEMGFDTFKLRSGTDWEEAGITPTKLAPVFAKLRAAVGPDFNLGLDKKGYDSYTFAESCEMARVLNDLDFLFFEQPMGDEGPRQFEDYLKIRELMPRVMLWGGERLGSLAQARPWLEQGIYDAVQIDCLHLGITECWQIGRVADYYGIKIIPHNWSTSLATAANLHLVAGIPNGHMCEFFMYPTGFRDGLFKQPYRPVDSYVQLSTEPGLGVELVDDVASRFPPLPGPETMANPRFPHAWERARKREREVAAQYSSTD